MSTVKKRIIIIVVLSALLLAVSVFLCFWFEPLHVFLPARTVETFLLYDHIRYEGVDYYYYDNEKLADGIVPDFDREISVEIMSSKNRSYGENKRESAYLCENDEGEIYIYYGSCHFTKDRSLACEPWYEE